MQAAHFEKLPDRTVKCLVCSHYCRIKNGRKGICRVRKNTDGVLTVENYPKVIAASIDPIEKKPVFHLKPGTTSYSIAAVGCNFNCTFCQNAHIAQVLPRQDKAGWGTQTDADRIVNAAVQSGCQSISYTYTEPTVFIDLALETAQKARQKGLYNIFVTNGYMSRETLDRLLPFLDAANVDLKAFSEDFYRKHCKATLAPVKKSIEQMTAAGTMVELTTLLIPGLNDSPEELKAMAAYIADTLGPSTPWHISRFHPCHQMTDRPVTPVSSLKTAYDIGKAAGLHYVYIGNVPGGDHEHTHCHKCGERLVERTGFRARRLYEKNGICPKCSTCLKGIF